MNRAAIVDHIDDVIATTAFAIETLKLERMRALFRAAITLICALRTCQEAEVSIEVTVMTLFTVLVYTVYLERSSLFAKRIAIRELTVLLDMVMLTKLDVMQVPYAQSGYLPNQTWMRGIDNAPEIAVSDTVKLPLGSQSAATVYALSTKLSRAVDLTLGCTVGIPEYLVKMSNYTRALSTMLN